MKVAFAGTPEFARVALERLHAAGVDINLVLTQPDRPAGRGMRLHASPVKTSAQRHGITVSQPCSLRLDGKFAPDAAAARAALLAAQPDVLVVAAYGLILPAWALALPRLGCLNIHASLLPRWRGAAPIQRAIEAGDAHTGITVMQMDAGLDTGDMLLAERVPIGLEDTAATLHERLAALGGRLIVEALKRCGRGELRAQRQPEAGVTYASKIAKSEGRVDWSQPAEVIERRLRAFDPTPGASGVLEGETIKLWRGHLVGGLGAPGDILEVSEDGILVACGQGALQLAELQRAGGKRVTARQFLQGHALSAGMRFQPRG